MVYPWKYSAKGTPKKAQKKDDRCHPTITTGTHTHGHSETKSAPRDKIYVRAFPSFLPVQCFSCPSARNFVTIICPPLGRPFGWFASRIPPTRGLFPPLRGQLALQSFFFTADTCKPPTKKAPSSKLAILQSVQNPSWILHPRGCCPPIILPIDLITPQTRHFASFLWGYVLFIYMQISLPLPSHFP